MPKREEIVVGLCIAACLLALTGTAAGQVAAAPDKPSQATQGESQETARPLTSVKPPVLEHAFWDRTNLELFAGVVAVRTMDYASTRHFRARGANENLLSNSIVDNKPLFAGIEVAATAASITASYVLHRTGHHKLEQWISIVHIGMGSFGDARNYTLSGPGQSP